MSTSNSIMSMILNTIISINIDSIKFVAINGVAISACYTPFHHTSINLHALVSTIV
jgi:hypothetical protein